MEVTIRSHMSDSTIEEISHQTILRVAEALGLTSLAPERFSAVLIMDLANLDAQGMPVHHVLDEIRGLEYGAGSSTKPSSPFKNPKFSKLWHKHFFLPTPNMLVTNMLSELGRNGIDRVAHEIYDLKEQRTLTDDLLNQLTDALTVRPFIRRWNAGRMTGEWLIYSPQPTGNLYLGACTHRIGDDGLLARLKIWEAEFPILAA